MTDLRISEYDICMMDKIRCLFTDIYPDQPDIVKKLCYDPTRQDHIVTKVAYWDQDIIGQANIFQNTALNGNANLGFHVHPSKRGLGIATILSNEVIKCAHSKGVRIFYIRTHKDNLAAIAVSRKLGFTRDDSRFADKGLAVFIKKIEAANQTYEQSESTLGIS